MSWTMDKLGPLARTAEDCGLVLEAIRGPDPQDPTTIAAVCCTTRPGGGEAVRVGILRGTREKVQPEVLRNFEASLSG